MPFTSPIINLQGSLSNPNIAIEAAKAGTLLPSGAPLASRLDQRAFDDARKSGLTAVVVTVGHVVGGDDPYARTLEDIDDWDNHIANRSNELTKILAIDDIVLARKRGVAGVIYGFQNTEMLSGNPERVEQFAAAGVKVMQLTYNTANRVGAGCMAGDHLGLSEFGVEVVLRMNACGVLIDASHAGSRTLRDAIQVSKHPIAVTHSSCRQLADTPRNVPDSDIRLLADHGGIFGIYAMPFLRTMGQPHLQDFVLHIEHAIQIAGEDHVGVGTDGSISQIDDVASYMGFLAEENARRRSAGANATGENEAVALFLPDMCGSSQFQILENELARRGHSRTRIAKVLGGNSMRVFQDAWNA